jgi:hypothetical protein
VLITTQTARLTTGQSKMQNPNPITNREVSADEHAPLLATHIPPPQNTPQDDDPTTSIMTHHPLKPTSRQNSPPSPHALPPISSTRTPHDDPTPQTSLDTSHQKIPTPTSRLDISTRRRTHYLPVIDPLTPSITHQQESLPNSNQPNRESLHQVRPGRRTLRQPEDVDLQASYGHSIYVRAETTIRIFFQNVKGLTYTTSGEDYAYYLSCVKNIGADIMGMAETNSAWTHFHLRNSFHDIAKKQYNSHKVSFSSPSIEVDPIPETEHYQSGGTITMANNSLVSMATGSTYNDQSGLGRWSTLGFRGQDDLLFTVFTAYRVCKGNIQSSPVGSAYSREYHHH